MDDESKVIERIIIVELKLASLQEDIAEIKRMLNSRYVTTIEFEPIKKLVYGTVGTILLAVVTALIGLLFNVP